MAAPEEENNNFLVLVGDDGEAIQDDSDKEKDKDPDEDDKFDVACFLFFFVFSERSSPRKILCC